MMHGQKNIKIPFRVL